LVGRNATKAIVRPQRIRNLSNVADRGGRIVLSGIQPTGIPHLGNYLGALQNWVSLQSGSVEGDKNFFMVVDLHALTSPKPSMQPGQLNAGDEGPVSVEKGTMDMVASFLAVGLDPAKSNIFVQSHVPQHAYLMWLLSCLTPLGKLNRMTTWKGKLAALRNANSEEEVDESLLNVGLFTYPVLQAADILLYRATHVPVGEDQRQHLELSRDIVGLLNKRMKGVKPIVVPEALITQEKRILSLRDPSQKMSKSALDPRSRILLTDSTEAIKKKIGGAVTDSIREVYWDEERRGVCNLITILAGCSSSGEYMCPDEEAKRLHGAIERCKGMDHAGLKALVVEAVEEKLKGPRAEFARLRPETGYLESVLREGSEKAREVAEETLQSVRRGLGLLPDLGSGGVGNRR